MFGLKHYNNRVYEFFFVTDVYELLIETLVGFSGKNSNWGSFPAVKMYKWRVNDAGRGGQDPVIWPQQARREEGLSLT